MDCPDRALYKLATDALAFTRKQYTCIVAKHTDIGCIKYPTCS